MARRSISSSLSKAEIVFDYLPVKRIVKVNGALCADRVRRTAFVIGPPNSDFSIPARLILGYKGKHISINGYIVLNSYDDVEFIAHPWGRHAWRIQSNNPTFVKAHHGPDRRARSVGATDVDSETRVSYTVVGHTGERVQLVRFDSLLESDDEEEDTTVPVPILTRG